MMGGHWMQGAVTHPGAFTKKAKAAGMTDHAFALKVTKNKGKYDTETVRQAELCLTFENASNKIKKSSPSPTPSLNHMKGFFQ